MHMPIFKRISTTAPFLSPSNISSLAEDAERFRLVMRQLRERRLRDGARRWRLYHDAQQPERYLELFRLDSWGEHLRQHERTTMADRELEALALQLHQGPSRPKVSHYFGVEA